jgi:uncharacterized membrane protein
MLEDHSIERPTIRDYREPAFIVIMVVGIALRFIALGAQSFWYDEAHSVAMAQGGADGTILKTVTNIHGPLYLTILRGWMAVLGTSEGVVRALSAILGSFGLFLFYRLGLRYFGRNTALIALALLAASPFYLWYSQEARNYALLFDLGLVAVPAFLTEMRTRAAGDFVAALIVTAATCLSNLSGFFLYVLFGIIAITTGRREGYPLRRFLLFAMVSAAILWPWISGGMKSTGDIILGRPGEGAVIQGVKGESPPGLMSLPFTIYNFSMGMTIGPSIDELKLERFTGAVPHLWYLLPGAAIFAGLFLRGLVRTPKDRRWLLFVWFAVPLTLMAALSVLNLKAPNSRYAFLSFAPFLYLIAVGAASIRSTTFKVTVLAFVFGIMGFADYQYFTDQRYWRPDTRSAGKLVMEEMKPGDAVVVYALDFPMRYYTEYKVDILKPPGKIFKSRDTMLPWLVESTAGKDRVWVVQCMSWWVDREDRFIDLCRERMTPAGEWQFNKVPVYLFEKRTLGGS